MYCVKCRKKTETLDVQSIVTKNGRHQLRRRCAICVINKMQFVRASAGAGFLNNLINKLPFEMHLPGLNFTGPGTKLDKRLNPDLKPKSWSMPINRVDNAAYHHDLCYAKHDDTATRNGVCDKDMLSDLHGIVNPTLREKIDKSIVSKIINSKVNFGMGHSKNGRVGPN